MTPALKLRSAALLAALCALTSVSTFAEEKITAGQRAFFEKKIRPALAKHCYECHSVKSGKDKGGLRLDTLEGIRMGGDSGHAVVPGNLKESLLIAAVHYEGPEMPPKYELSAEVVADLEKWVKMGAPDPRESEKLELIVREIDFEKAREFWSFKKPGAASAPGVKNKRWPRSDLDRHVLARLEAEGLKPVGDAGKAALLRRAHFDLTGLPPSPEELERFLADDSKEAFEKVVDRLLESRGFGVRWGRHWLDVVRYAESSGKERNFVYPAAWRYRDYVIDAFNRDVPYDRFIKEQIAGDLLESNSREERDRLLVATGALALGPKSHNESSAAKFTMDLIDDQIDVTTRAFLALTVSCARCHDHKFDPIPTREYYSMAGIFQSSKTYYGTKKTNGNRRPSTLMPIGESADTGDQLTAKEEALFKRLSKQVGASQSRLNKLKKQKNGKSIEREKQKLAKLRKQFAPLKAKKPADGDLAMGVKDASKPSDCAIRVRGDEAKKGETVSRGFLSILSEGEGRELPADQSGRLQLADWIASSDNPLTARVMANRIWQHLFGRGLVRTVDNFGMTGERPSHPELLDHLAARLVANEWSVKGTIREIMLSRTYRLSVAHDEHNHSKDPDNFLVWRMNRKRLEAEAIRDGMLAASGRLDKAPGIASFMADKEGDIGRRLKVSVSENDNVRRSVYLPVVRDELPEMFKVFDFAEPSLVVGRRDPTTVPTQALFMMNSRFVLAQSRILAKLIIDERDGAAERIETAYRRTLSRPPTTPESARGLRFVEETRAALDGEDPDGSDLLAWTSFCQALFASAEFRYLN
jgi:cytochrome c553